MNKNMDVVLLADTHITVPCSWSMGMRNLRAMMMDITQQEYQTILINGDLTNQGYACQLKTFFDFLKEYPEKHFLINIGNHDTWAHGKRDMLSYAKQSLSSLYQTSLPRIYHSYEIDDIVFLMLNPETKCRRCSYLSREQLDWLKQNLMECEKQKKQVIICCHHPLQGDLVKNKGMSIGPQNDELYDLLSQFHDLIYISGHTHHHYSECGVQQTSFGYLLDIPSFHLNGRSMSHHGSGIVLSIRNDMVTIRYRNFLTSTWLPKSYHIDLSMHTIEETNPLLEALENVMLQGLKRI